MHNAIVHNLPEQGTMWVTTSAQPKSVVLTVENSAEKLTPQFVCRLPSRFSAHQRIRTDHAGVGLGRQRQEHPSHDGTLTLTPRAAGGLRVTVQLPPRHHTPGDDDQRNWVDALERSEAKASVCSSGGTQRLAMRNPAELCLVQGARKDHHRSHVFVRKPTSRSHSFGPPVGHGPNA